MFQSQQPNQQPQSSGSELTPDPQVRHYMAVVHAGGLGARLAFFRQEGEVVLDAKGREEVGLPPLEDRPAATVTQLPARPTETLAEFTPVHNVTVPVEPIPQITPPIEIDWGDQRAA